MNDYAHWTKYVESEVIEVLNAPNKAKNTLYLEYKAQDPNISASTRSQYIITAQDEGTEIETLKKIYWKMDMKMDLSSTQDWNLPWEWKISGESSRVGLYIANPGTDNAYWLLQYQYGTTGTNGYQWKLTNHDILVPNNEWFTIETYWHSTSLADGFWKVAVNGQVLFNVSGETRKPGTDNNHVYVMPFKIYGSKGKSWITNFEIWDSPPSNSILSTLH